MEYKKSMIFLFVLGAISLLVNFPSAYADGLVFSDGRTTECIIVSEDDQSLTASVDGNTLVFLKQELKEIKRDTPLRNQQLQSLWSGEKENREAAEKKRLQVLEEKKKRIGLLRGGSDQSATNNLDYQEALAIVKEGERAQKEIQKKKKIEKKAAEDKKNEDADPKTSGFLPATSMWGQKKMQKTDDDKNNRKKFGESKFSDESTDSTEKKGEKNTYKPLERKEWNNEMTFKEHDRN
jgi:hypothetical protein